MALNLIAPEKCSTVYLGVNIHKKVSSPPHNPDISAVLNKKYVLFVGCLEIRKNIGHVIEAVLPVNNLDLVIAGQTGHGYEQHIRGKLAGFPQERLHRYNKISSNDLGLLYKNAVATLLPSWEEGFGLPILEAMASGCPIITSNRSANAEIAGNSAVLVDPGIPKQSQQSILRLLEDNQLRSTLVQAGLERVEQFSWENYYQRLVNVYKKLLL